MVTTAHSIDVTTIVTFKPSKTITIVQIPGRDPYEFEVESAEFADGKLVTLFGWRLKKDTSTRYNQRSYERRNSIERSGNLIDQLDIVDVAARHAELVAHTEELSRLFNEPTT